MSNTFATQRFLPVPGFLSTVFLFPNPSLLMTICKHQPETESTSWFTRKPWHAPQIRVWARKTLAGRTVSCTFQSRLVLQRADRSWWHVLPQEGLSWRFRVIGAMFPRTPRYNLGWCIRNERRDDSSAALASTWTLELARHQPLLTTPHPILLLVDGEGTLDEEPVLPTLLLEYPMKGCVGDISIIVSLRSAPSPLKLCTTYVLPSYRVVARLNWAGVSPWHVHGTNGLCACYVDHN